MKKIGPIWESSQVLQLNGFLKRKKNNNITINFLTVFSSPSPVCQIEKYIEWKQKQAKP